MPKSLNIKALFIKCAALTISHTNPPVDCKSSLGYLHYLMQWKHYVNSGDTFTGLFEKDEKKKYTWSAQIFFCYF